MRNNRLPLRRQHLHQPQPRRRRLHPLRHLEAEEQVEARRVAEVLPVEPVAVPVQMRFGQFRSITDTPAEWQRTEPIPSKSEAEVVGQPVVEPLQVAAAVRVLPEAAGRLLH